METPEASFTIQAPLNAHEKDGKGEPIGDLFDLLNKVYLKEWMLNNKRGFSSITNCLVLIMPDKTIVYINIPMVAEIISLATRKAGAPVYRDDIADIASIELLGVDIPPNTAYIFYHHFLQKRTILFDFFPNLNDQSGVELPRDHIVDLKGSIKNQIVQDLFPALFKASLEGARSVALEKGWFPFARLRGSKLTRLCELISNNEYDEKTENDFINTFKEEDLNQMVESWVQKPRFKRYERSLREGVDNYINGRYISAISIFYPRIEGFFQQLGIEKTGTMDTEYGRLTGYFIQESRIKHPVLSVDLRREFVNYLKNTFFNKISEESIRNGSVRSGRIGFAHGILDDNEMTKLRAIQAILILDELFVYSK